MVIVETIALDATDAERALREIEIAKTYADLAEAGLNPCVVLVEATSSGDVFVIEADVDLGDATGLD